MIILNLLMAFGSIWGFMRMSPVIDILIHKNTRTLVYCQNMLVSIAKLGTDKEENQELLEDFTRALERAQRNITENEEPTAIDAINKSYKAAFAGDHKASRETVKAIVKLSTINRQAMYAEDVRAKKLGSAGAWGVVFMASAVFLVAILLIRVVRRNLLVPLEEVYAVLMANMHGDKLRRCSGTGDSSEVKLLYDTVNAVLDSKQQPRV